MMNFPEEFATSGLAPISKGLIDAIVGLADLDHVNTFSLPFLDKELWIRLVEKQVARAKGSQKAPFHAMPLIATGVVSPALHDSKIRRYCQWGGEIGVATDDTVHPADVFARPSGLGVDMETAKTAANLSQAVFDPWYKERNSYCKYFLAQTVHGEDIAGTTKTIFGDWTLYRQQIPST